MSMPMMVVIRDMLHVCDTAAEGQARSCTTESVLVDGKVVTSLRRFPVGLMDVVSIPKIETSTTGWSSTSNGKFRLVKIPEGKSRVEAVPHREQDHRAGRKDPAEPARRDATSSWRRTATRPETC